jgi:hypothetical protein
MQHTPNGLLQNLGGMLRNQERVLQLSSFMLRNLLHLQQASLYLQQPNLQVLRIAGWML